MGTLTTSDYLKLGSPNTMLFKMIDNTTAKLYLYNYSDSTIMPTELTGPSYKSYYFYIDAINGRTAAYSNGFYYLLDDSSSIKKLYQINESDGSAVVISSYLSGSAGAIKDMQAYEDGVILMVDINGNTSGGLAIQKLANNSSSPQTLVSESGSYKFTEGFPGLAYYTPYIYYTRNFSTSGINYFITRYNLQTNQEETLNTNYPTEQSVLNATGTTGSSTPFRDVGEDMVGLVNNKVILRTGSSNLCSFDLANKTFTQLSAYSSTSGYVTSIQYNKFPTYNNKLIAVLTHSSGNVRTAHVISTDGTSAGTETIAIIPDSLAPYNANNPPIIIGDKLLVTGDNYDKIVSVDLINKTYQNILPPGTTSTDLKETVRNYLFQNSLNNRSCFYFRLNGLGNESVWVTDGTTANTKKVIELKNNLTYNISSSTSMFLTPQGDLAIITQPINQGPFEMYLSDCGGGILDFNTAIHEHKTISEIKLSPNPATHTLTITLPNNKQPIPIVITNLLGEVVIKEVADSERKVIDVAALPRGMYFINRKKFVKE